MGMAIGLQIGALIAGMLVHDGYLKGLLLGFAVGVGVVSILHLLGV